MADEPTFRIRLKEKQTYTLNAAGRVSTARLVYHVNDLAGADTADIMRAVQAAAPAWIESAQRNTAEVVDLPDGDCCDIAVTYNEPSTPDPKKQRQVGDERWAFEASTGEITATTALEQVAVVDETTGAALTPYIADQIGWNGKFGAESACAGVSVYAPSTRLTCRRTVAAATAQTQTFEQNIVDLQRHVNSSTFHGYSAGQVLFLGASVSEEYYNDDGDLLVDVNYSFAVRANEAATVIGQVTLPAKNGWDYAWTITAFDPVTGKNETVAGVVSRVYDTADLTTLGIGGSGA